MDDGGAAAHRIGEGEAGAVGGRQHELVGRAREDGGGQEQRQQSGDDEAPRGDGVTSEHRSCVYRFEVTRL
ncbi:hypothetical protein [Acuticoccus mangrovi]|uniref:hypothetical protein n=1 Tax=Acuticoccus mangrovi TaxID=2796142 RepID=UPI0018E9868D|nr:hypothetical protein [Acuticoccus mangrovi]